MRHLLWLIRLFNNIMLILGIFGQRFSIDHLSSDRSENHFYTCRVSIILLNFFSTNLFRNNWFISWVEMDPYVITSSVAECIEKVCEYLGEMGLNYKNIKAIGLTNHRETTLLWDKITGKPLYNAIGMLVISLDLKILEISHDIT